MQKVSVHDILNKVLAVIFLLLCISCTVDTHLFVYQSLSKSLAFSLCSLFIAICSMMICVRRSAVTLMGMFMMTWGIYIIIYSLFVPAETYRMYYLLSGIIFFWAMSGLLYTGLISFRQIGNGLLLIACIHIIFVVGQKLGLIDPLSDYFQITGSNENPNITAMYMVGVLPLLYGRMAERRWRGLYAALGLTVVCLLLALRCRTAWVGLAVIIMVYGCMSVRLRRCFSNLNVSQKIGLCIVAVCLLVAGAVSAYHIKKDSADGRMLVWKLSAQMISERPNGYGYGLFERNYNLRQAEYFVSGEQLPAEQRNAGFVSMAYNDYLEQAVEGGVAGAFLFIAFYAIMILKAYRDKDVEALAVVSAFAVMSLFNFIYSSIQPWILLLCYGARLNVKGKSIGKVMSPVLYCFMAFIVCLVVYNQVRATSCQARLTAYCKALQKGLPVSVESLQVLSDGIGTSELYNQTMAQAMKKQGDYIDAIAYMDEALKYTSAPDMFFFRALCHFKTGQMSEAERDLKLVANMLPMNIRSRIWLMRLYEKSGRHNEAMEMARFVADMPVKVATGEALRFRREAATYINKRK